MAAFVGRRLLTLPVLLLLITFLVYSLVLLLPGDPARSIAGGLNAPEEQVEEVREELGLDDPLLVQYGRWLKGVYRVPGEAAAEPEGADGGHGGEGRDGDA